MTAPFFRLTKRGRGLRPVHDVGRILREKPTINAASLNGLKRLAKYGPGPRRGWDDK